MAFSTTYKSHRYTLLEMAYLRLFASQFRKDNEERFSTTSPYGLTTQVPGSRIVDNAIIKGNGAPISSSSSVVRGGLFNTVKGVVNNVSGGGWGLDTKIQFDEIFLCPVTGREFREKDMESYKSTLYNEQKWYAEEKMKELVFHQDIGTLGTIVKHPDGRMVTIMDAEMMDSPDKMYAAVEAIELGDNKGEPNE